MTAQRLHILNDNDIAALYAAPEFNATERSHFFALPPVLLKSLKITKTNGKNTPAKLYFILQYGYFKAKHQFFNFSYQDVKHDVAFIMAQYFPKGLSKINFSFFEDSLSWSNRIVPFTMKFIFSDI